MRTVKLSLRIFMLVLFLYPFHLHAEQKIKPGSIVPSELIGNTIDIFVEMQQIYLIKRSGNKETKIEFEKSAKELIIGKYQHTMVPEEFKDERKHPFFTESVIEDVEKVSYASYKTAVISLHNSLLNFQLQLRTRTIKPIIKVLKSHVSSAFQFWAEEKCDIYPQPIPPCPEDCVKKTYQRILARYGTAPYPFFILFHSKVCLTKGDSAKNS